MRLQIWHIVVLIIAFVLLFGWKNPPNVARSLGESMRVFKTEVDQMKDENAARKDSAAVEPPEHDRDEPGRPGGHEQRDQHYHDTAQEEYRRAQQHGTEGDAGAPRP